MMRAAALLGLTSLQGNKGWGSNRVVKADLCAHVTFTLLTSHTCHSLCHTHTTANVEQPPQHMEGCRSAPAALQVLQA